MELLAVSPAPFVDLSFSTTCQLLLFAGIATLFFLLFPLLFGLGIFFFLLGVVDIFLGVLPKQQRENRKAPIV